MWSYFCHKTASCISHRDSGWLDKAWSRKIYADTGRSAHFKGLPDSGLLLTGVLGVLHCFYTIKHRARGHVICTFGHNDTDGRTRQKGVLYLQKAKQQTFFI